jgi:hypothetical protein
LRRTRSLVSIIGLVDTYHAADTERPEPIQNSKIQAGGPYRRDTEHRLAPLMGKFAEAVTRTGFFPKETVASE